MSATFLDFCFDFLQYHDKQFVFKEMVYLDPITKELKEELSPNNL